MAPRNCAANFACNRTQIYAVCTDLEAAGFPILRPPRDGHMAFVKTPDGVSIELLQANGSLPPQEPWKSRASGARPIRTYQLLPLGYWHTTAPTAVGGGCG